MCMGGGGSSAPTTTPMPTQDAGNSNNGAAAVAAAPAPTNTTTDPTKPTEAPDRGVSSLRIKRGRGSTSVPASGTGLNIPT